MQLVKVDRISRIKFNVPRVSLQADEGNQECANGFDKSVFQRRFACCLHGSEFEAFVAKLLN